MTYELWDTKTRNAIGGFASQAEALAVVREAIERHGREYVDMLFLGCEDENGRSRRIARGQALADLALSSNAHQAATTGKISVANSCSDRSTSTCGVPGHCTRQMTSSTPRRSLY